ncbi:DUF937 domain-containing protein [Neolewinella aurantiaca]|uniref:DUF937 domain-containing protein n=1 Tax=Neolewinella aurantiaca TaxID=2602767 RepID=A0A5C7FCA1_9BACT|nr:DUF937 domain-containing protein [Neolewinella aurantiaca]TXF87098.1 DUF937 domain-containing protein [Neolewinella aurantiaca]
MDFSQLLQQQLKEQLSGGLMDALTQQTGTDRTTTTKATSAIISTMMGALARNASTPQGANSLSNALDRDHDGSILDVIGGLMKGGQEAPGQGLPTGGGLMDLVTGMAGGGGGNAAGGLLGSLLGGVLGGGQQQQPQSSGGIGDLLGGLMSATQGSDGGGIGDLLGGLLGGTQTPGHDKIPPQFRKTVNGGGILDHVLGAQKTEAAEQISQTSGLSMSKVLPLMATLAPILMGMLGKTKRQTGTDASGLGGALIDMVTKSQSNPRQNAPDLGLAGTLLDSNGDGQIMDDLLGMGAKMLGGYFSK